MREFDCLVNVYINSAQTSPTLMAEGRDGLEDDLDEFLGEEGCCSGGGAGRDAWNVDLDINGAGDWEGRVNRVVDFLRMWGVPPDTFLTVVPPQWGPGMPTRKVPVFPDVPDAKPGSATDIGRA